MELVNAVDREVARVFAAASAISQAVCFFRMKATAEGSSTQLRVQLI
jgi:hypothetical protein